MARSRLDETDDEFDARSGHHPRLLIYSLLGVLLFACGAIVYPIWRATWPVSPPNQALSEIKILDLAVQMYAGDHDELLPLASNWMDSVDPYIPRSGNATGTITDPPPPKLVNPIGSAFRRRLAGVNSTEIKDPQQVALLFNSINQSRNAVGELDLLPNPPLYKVSGHEVNIVGFVDGHASFTLPGIPIK